MNADHTTVNYPAVIYQKSMRTGAMRAGFALAVVAGLAIPLTACETIKEQTGLSKSAQTGAAGGAAFGGIIAALAGANPAWIAASVILGGVTGGLIGDHLGKEDAQRHAANNLKALDGLGEGQTESWSDDRTGNHGSTTVVHVARQEDGALCKSYRETVHAGSETVTKEATACRAPGGTWRVV